MQTNFSDILEISQMDQIRAELDLLTSEFRQTERAGEKHALAYRMRNLIHELEKHNIAIKKSMIVPLNM